MISYQRHHQIDQAAWDRRLAASANSAWYGSTTALNAAAPGWDALVDEETGAQMPLPWRLKFGVRYLYQPFLLQHLGPYAPGQDQDLAAQFLRAVPRRFRYADIQVAATEVPTLKHWHVDARINHLLHLNGTLEELRAGYSENHRRSVKKAAKLGLQVRAEVSGAEVAEVIAESEQFRNWGVGPEGRMALHKALAATERDGTGFGHIIRSDQGPLAVGWFVRHGPRILFLKGLGTDAGRELRAMHALIDHVVEEFAGTGLILDLAGGNDPQLARFYAGFGAQREVYLRALMNRLPPVVRLLKP